MTSAYGMQPSRITKFTLSWFVGFFFMTGISAYSAGPIPVPWLAQAGMIALAVGVVLYLGKIRPVPGAWLLLMLIAWAVLSTAMNGGEYAMSMPIKATLPYWAYVAIRYVNVFSFLAAVYLTYWLCTEGEGSRLLKWIVLSALIICAISLYIYLAHIYGWPEPPRNRGGTGGAGQATSFSSGSFAYPRATGTFREPSGLADWMILPFFLAFRFAGRRRKLYAGLILFTILLTVSMTGVFSVVVGSLLALLITKPLSKRTYKIVGIAVLILAVILLALSRITVGLFGSEKTNLAIILAGRAITTVTGGVKGSNRGYVYDFAAEHPPTFVGIGMGNANILAAEATSNESVVSLLSLYLFTLYSTGVPGLIMLLSFLVRPIIRYVREIRRVDAWPVVLMAYVAYLVSGAVGSEELTPYFGVAAGLLIAEGQQIRKAMRFSTGVSPLRPIAN